MTASELREKYLNFFKSKEHAIIPSVSLIPLETDASTLFTSAGMQPMVPYFLGEDHPGGRRIVNVQKCIRTVDIDDVGDNRHCTFFEMMGNWSFGDYFKEESIEWSFEFLTDKNMGLGLDPDRLYVTVFKGVDGVPMDEESIAIWQKVFKEKTGFDIGIAGEDEIIEKNVKIIPLGMDDNFWIAGKVGPCGGDTEMFYDTRPEEGKINGKFSELVKNGRIIEIWNNVFMEYEKRKAENGEGQDKYEYAKLKQKNVDTGMGVERTLAILNGKENVFETELFEPIIRRIEDLSGKKYDGNKREFRIVADHVKASVFIAAEGIEPANVGRGYILRRLIRRAVRFGRILGIEDNFVKEVADIVIGIYKDFYNELLDKEEFIYEILENEESKFKKTLEQGLREFNKLSSVSGKDAFNLYQTYGFPLEMTEELAREKKIKISKKEFKEEFKKHQELSQTSSRGMFKGGLQDTSEQSTRLHTAAHLMLAALRQVLGNHVVQKGSNITPERLRFDFSHPEKMTPEQIAKVEELVNGAIGAGMEIIREEMSLEEARRKNAMGVFESKYKDKVSVYSIANPKSILVSCEICGGPHVKNTAELGHFKIVKEESSSAGVRRIKAVLE